MTTTNDIQRDVAERFKSDTADHTMTVLHDDGLYRHLRVSKPGTSFYWFEIITWPGSLAIRGDCGGYMFSRVRDMFEFFRANGNLHGINPGYWAEKLPDSGRSVKKYSEDALRAALAPYLDDYDREYPDAVTAYEQAKAEYDTLPYERRWPYGNTREPVEPKTPAEVRELIADHDDDGLLGYDSGARELLAELEKAGVVSDTWEWSLTDWDWQFLWCCHAIAWAVTQYDLSTGRAARVTTVELDAARVEIERLTAELAANERSEDARLAIAEAELEKVRAQLTAATGTPVCNCCFVDGSTQRCGRPATTIVDVPPFGFLDVAETCRSRINGEPAGEPERPAGVAR